jgi:hypothetical protein
LGSMESDHFLLESDGKILITVRNNKMRHVVEIEDVIHKTLSHSGCCERELKRI